MFEFGEYGGRMGVNKLPILCDLERDPVSPLVFSLLCLLPHNAQGPSTTECAQTAPFGAQLVCPCFKMAHVLQVRIEGHYCFLENIQTDTMSACYVFTQGGSDVSQHCGVAWVGGCDTVAQHQAMTCLSQRTNFKMVAAQVPLLNQPLLNI